MGTVEMAELDPNLFSQLSSDDDENGFGWNARPQCNTVPNRRFMPMPRLPSGTIRNRRVTAPPPPSSPVNETPSSTVGNRDCTDLPLPSSPEDETHSATNATNKDSWRSEWAERCESAFPRMKELFKLESMHEAILESFAGSCAQFLHEEGIRGLLNNNETYGAIWGSLFFAIKPGKSKMEWESLCGKHNIEMRTRIVRAVIAVTSIDGGTQSGNGRPVRASHIISDVIIQKGKLRQVGRKHRAKNLKNRTCTLNDAASEAVAHLYSQTGKMLMQGKQRMSDAFFREVGYFFVAWSEYSVEINNVGYKVEKETLKLQPVTGKEAVWDELIAGAPEMIERADGDTSNMEGLNDMIKKAAVCSMRIKHEVMVKRKSGADRGERNDAVNFLVLAEKMVLTYTRNSNRSAFLRSTRHSLKTLVGMAKILYMLVDKVIAETRLHMPNDDGTSRNVIVGNVDLNTFMPRKSRMKLFMEKGVCLKGKYDDLG